MEQHEKTKMTREERKAKLREFAKSWSKSIRDSKRDGTEGSMEKRDSQMFIRQLLGECFELKYGEDFTFELPIKGSWADVWLPGKLLIEMKSPGKDLDKAYQQVKKYWENLPHAQRPRFVIVSDFENFHVYDMNIPEVAEQDLFGTIYVESPVEKFTLKNLPDRVHSLEVFAPLIGIDQFVAPDLFDKQLALNRAAAEKIGKLHGMLEKLYKTDHRSDLEVLLIRIVFCLFAEDAEGLFSPNSFTDFLKNQTTPDTASDELTKLFEFLDTPPEDREQRLKVSPYLNSFPYVNGGLFKKTIRIKPFTKKIFDCLIECTTFNWAQITPDLFGSIFQSATDEEERRSLGEHYTTPQNIRKVLNPLFLDKLKAEFENILKDFSSNRWEKLARFQDKLASIKVFDPACGCGNFLVVAYRELRQLELNVLEALKDTQEAQNFVLKDRIKVSIKQFYGLEIKEFPCEIAQLSMWLMQLICDNIAKERFCQTFTSIPLKGNPNIQLGNAATIDWNTCFPVQEKTNAYIVGNPPFVGNYNTTSEQRKEVTTVFNNMRGSGKLDYVSVWFRKAANFMNQHPNVETALVSTNSIFQGEQVYPLWSSILGQEGFRIKFFYECFKWENEARNAAAVHCVITGLTLKQEGKPIYYAWDEKSAQHIPQECDYINAYGKIGYSLLVHSERNALSAPLPMLLGNKPNDDGSLLLSPQDYEVFKQKEPKAMPYVKKLIGAHEFLHNGERYCLWLVGASPKILSLPLVRERIERCKQYRLEGKETGRIKLASRPSQFRDLNNPKTAVVIPTVSSERRYYIPMGFITEDTIATNAVHIVPDGGLYEFGILTSRLHMVWMKTTCGRMKSDFRYSRDLCYNTFPWPKATDKQKAEIATCAQAILDVRKKYSDTDLATMYNELTMPPELLKAHEKLDKAVERLYNPKGFKSDTQRLNTLISLYSALKAELDLAEQPKKGKRKTKKKEEDPGAPLL